MKVTTHTQFDIENRPSNVSYVMNDDDWYHFCNELGNMNDRINDSWSVFEILKRADERTGYGFRYVTSFDLFNEMKIIEDSHKI